jgi:hypothetical protein
MKKLCGNDERMYRNFIFPGLAANVFLPIANQPRCYNRLKQIAILSLPDERRKINHDARLPPPPFQSAHP